MKSAVIPERFQAADGDLVMAAAIDAGLGLFTINIEAAFRHRLDGDRLATACMLLFDSQPILGCRLVVQDRDIYWERLNKKDWGSLQALKDIQEYENFKTEQVDSRIGPQVKVGICKDTTGDILIIKASHQVGDGGGLHDIARELSRIYTRLKYETAYQPEPNIDGSRSGKQIFKQIPWSAVPVIFTNYLKLMWADNHPGGTHTLPLAAWRQAPWRYTIRHIPGEHAARIAAYGKEKKVSLNDVLVTAYLRALARMGGWKGESALRLQMTVDLRKWYLPAKRAAGICNLSGFEYVNLGTFIEKNFDATLARVASITSARKSSYIGLSEAGFAPLLPLLPYPRLAKMVDSGARKKAAKKNVPPVLTNTGSISPEIVTFDEPPHAVWMLPPVLFSPCFMTLVSCFGETITFSTGVAQESYALVETFFNRMITELPQ